MNEARAPDFFSANAARYDRSRPALISDSTRDAMVRAARLPAGGRLLDVAAGTGRVGGSARRGWLPCHCGGPVEGHARRPARQEATRRIDAAVASGVSLPFRDRTFDAVVIARLLYLTPDWQRILVEALRLLTAGGRLLHEWANGTPSEPSCQIKEHLRTLLEEAGVAEPFHPGVRRESDVDAFLSERGCALVDAIDVPIDGEMLVGDFLSRIEAGEFSYTWNAPAPVRDRCVASLRSWASEQFDMNAPALATSTSWKVFEAI